MTIIDAQEKQRNVKYNDTNRIQRIFELGDYVLVKVDIRTKEDDRFAGPYKIIRKLHDRNYELENEKAKKF